ncbi:MAG: helix-turn-helix domain-containing protein [Pseudomonadota bacterium]
MDQTTTQTRKRLSKADRKRQLLEIAKAMLEADGADALTLARLAERAGVSKPIAYDHFESKSGLLVALLEDTSRYYETDAEAKFAAAPATIPAIADIVAAAYVKCAIAAGPATTTLAAAAEADTEARSAGRALQSRHGESFSRAFEPVLEDDRPRLQLLFRGLVAASNAICDDLTQNRITAEAAIETLRHLLVTSLTPFARTTLH